MPSRLGSANYAIGRIKNFVSLKICYTLYNSLFKSHLEFGILAFGCAKMSKLKKIVNLQKKCIRNVKKFNFRSHTDPLFDQLSILRFEDLFKYNVCSFFHKFITKRLPPSFHTSKGN